jgi:hypothetical protein
MKILLKIQYKFMSSTTLKTKDVTVFVAGVEALVGFAVGGT